MPRPKDWRDVAARCPFYRSIESPTARRIGCAEGPVDRSRVSLTFEREDDINRFFDDYCCGDFTICPIFEMIIDKKYPEERNDVF